MKSFSLRGETRSPEPRSPELSALPAEAEARTADDGGGGTASSMDSPYDSPYRTPVEPRRILVLAISCTRALKMAGLRGPRGLQMDRGQPGLGAAPQSIV